LIKIENVSAIKIPDQGLGATEIFWGIEFA